ncbi:MAG TPA: condensation domain-containing protein, partial [Pyrinomonadaceae bacterium]|nr:condensation domain-containing protein [Pyrinomonadaceae bacterium]
MNNLTERIDALSPEQRALFEARMKRARPPAPKPQGIARRGPAGARPLSLDQEQLWFLAQLDPRSYAYNLSNAYALGGALDVAALRRALNEVVRRHEVLRTSFPADDGVPVQRVAPELTLPVPLVDLRDLPAAGRAPELRRVTRRFTREPFDLAAGPLLRAALVRAAEDEFVMLLTLHHAVMDRWSFSILWRELTTLYEAFSAGRPSPLPELPAQFGDYAAWQRERLRGDLLEAHLDFWRRRLAGSAFVLELPADRPRPPAQTFDGARHYWHPPKPLWDELGALCRREGVTMFMTVLAAFNVLLYRYTGQEDINVGTPFANRDRAETEGMIGYLLNMIVMRTDLAGNPTFRELLGRVRAATLDAYQHGEVPFGLVVEALRPPRDLSRNPVFQVSYVHVDSHDTLGERPELSIKDLQVDAGSSVFDLTLGLRNNPDRPTLILEYSTDLFDESTILRMASHFQTLLHGIVARPDARLSELPLLTDSERRRLVVEFNDTARDYPADECVHRLFERQVRRTPDALALVCEGARLTYAELNARANRLARDLRGRGVRLESRVGLAAGRSPATLVALLAILKAGAAYVPLDGSLPPARLKLILERAGVGLLLADSRHRERWDGCGAEVVRVGTEPADLAPRDAANLGAEVPPDSLAYVMHTSGSTGEPKAVMVTHRSVVNLWAALAGRAYAPHEPVRRVSLNAPLSFDSSVKQLVQLLSGRALCVVPEGVRADGAAMLDWLAGERVGGLDCTPTQLRLLLEAGLVGREDLRLRVGLVGGEAV